jgi:outer membrane immunogenic protein
MAADIPLKAPVYMAPLPAAANWTGVYIGGHLGGSWGTKEWDQTRAAVSATGNFVDFFGPGITGGNLPTSFPIDGFLGGAQAGYRYQSAMWVFGIEGSFSGADLSGRSTCFDFVCRSKVDWLANLTGQVGWAVDHALLYIKGGGAWVNDKHTLDFGPCALGAVCSGSTLATTRSGWLFGAGVTYAFDPHWSAFVEYNYMDFGRTNAVLTASEVSLVGSLIETRTFDIEQKLHVIKAGVNYRFDWGGPVVAKY